MQELRIVPKRDCCGCSACCVACPTGCIEMRADVEGFLFPVITDTQQCISCKKCGQVCPIRNATQQIALSPNLPVAFAVINNDEQIRRQSASGGVFSLLAEEVLANHGVVFGAAMSVDCTRVEHIWIEDNAELFRLRNSKYMQSDMGACYQKAKDFLVAGRQVLFSGTPCQIAGLKSYLRADFPNLFCVDLICFGVSSSKVWKRYKMYCEERENSEIIRSNFHNKTNGWKDFSMALQYKNGTEYCASHKTDLYMQSFFKKICLRQSCYHCKFKTVHRISDLTMADLWGVEHILPEWNDDRGISLLLVHSKKGQKLFDEVKKCSRFCPIDRETAIRFNSSAIKSAGMHPNRKRLFRDLEQLPFDELMRRYSKRPATLKAVVKKVLRKLDLC